MPSFRHQFVVQVEVQFLLVGIRFDRIFKKRLHFQKHNTRVFNNTVVGGCNSQYWRENLEPKSVAATAETLGYEVRKPILLVSNQEL